MQYIKISYNKNMKKLIVTILLVSVLGCGCGGVNNKVKLETPNLSLENKEEVIANPAPQKAEDPEKKAEELYPIEIEEQECMKKADYTTAGMSECSYKAMDAWFKEIDKYLGLLKTITSEEDYANILKVQEKWKKYQESEFEAVSIIMNKQGTMFQNVAVSKKTDIIKERALGLKGLYDTLKYE